MPKYIICDCARANWGKSTTLIAVNNLFEDRPLQYHRLALPFSPIFSNVRLYKDVSTQKTVWIQSDGDNIRAFQDLQQYLTLGNSVDIIICACRDHGVSRKELDNIAHTFGYTQVFFNNFSPIGGRSKLTYPIVAINTTLLAQAIQQLALTI